MGKLFTEDEENFILENWEKYSNKELAENIGRDIKDTQIRSWLQHHGIWRRGKNVNESCRFSEQDISFIKDNYQTMEYKEIAKELGFTEINDDNISQVFAKIAEIQSRKTAFK